MTLSIILFSGFPGLSASFPVPRKRDLAHTYRTHNPLNSRGFNGKRTEHQIGEGFTKIDTLRPSRNDRYMIQNIAREREFLALSLLRFPFFLAVLLSNFSFKYFRHSLVLNWSKFPSSEDTRPAADEWKHQFQFIFQYQWISARSMALVSMFLCNKSYASHGRDFLLGATILNFDGGSIN